MHSNLRPERCSFTHPLPSQCRKHSSQWDPRIKAPRGAAYSPTHAVAQSAIFCYSSGFPPHRHTCKCIICHAGMHARHYLPHRHACSGIIGHTGTTLSATHTLTHAMASSATRACKQLLAVTFAATQAVSATQACMQVQNPPHSHAHTTLAATVAHMEEHTLPHMRLHNLPYSAILVVSATQARMQLHNWPHKEACRCILCHAGMHALHYLPHRHACSGIIGHTGTA